MPLAITDKPVETRLEKLADKMPVKTAKTPLAAAILSRASLMTADELHDWLSRTPAAAHVDATPVARSPQEA